MNITELENRIAILEREAKSYTPEERNNKVEALTEEFYASNGRHMHSIYLQRLADVLLVEELKDSNPNKITSTEQPILSNRQILRRKKREFALTDDKLDFVHAKEHLGIDSLFKKRTQNMDDQN
ncbi:hypothetical protein COK07_29035 [Bacillus thuringiensis]|uniref:hypothetical protein n=1 Tax=Bacillus thuringiensis TaxID=1428 RepID=UPI000BED15B2|nr:hypothetical protein [Bacillus thuringiensis]PEF03572.1 hypothetical protein COM97_26560 [Bacillus thuringiensis]PFI26725.1 hypothetical protein COI53_27000 [Bacillus thuringiensis]PFP70000.1 hypothetical protein COK07_29035 [Bacillus thuringiensis]